MSYISRDEISTALEGAPQFKEVLYNRGFVLTNDKLTMSDGYPFYGNWRELSLTDEFSIYAHVNTYVNIYTAADKVHFLIGHSYDPYHMIADEKESLKRLAEADKKEYWEEESCLTGVFCIGYVSSKGAVFTTDCAGMQLVYHGVINGKLYVTSHSKLVADLTGLEQPKYIRKLVTNRFWHYWGTWLPADLSPFAELSRMVPNCAGYYRIKDQNLVVKRFYPKREINEVTTEKEFEEIIHELGRIMSNNMALIAQKWPEKKVSISVTGGRDSMTCLSCSKEVYDKYHYFSYISNYDESVDADAAKKILDHLGLEHELYEIPEEWDGYKDLDVFQKVMECNAGCIGHNNVNDLKKRLYFCANPPCDMEVKSWVNEMGRGWYYNKYNKKHFPKYPNASYWRAMHKVYMSPYLIHETDKAFRKYLKKYYSREVFDKMDWLEMYFWEFAWSGGEGVFLTSEHRVSYDITVPFNNRKYVELMLTAPLAKRKVEGIPDTLITYMEPRIRETGIVIHDVSHTSMRAFIVRCYLEIMSKVRL